MPDGSFDEIRVADGSRHRLLAPDAPGGYVLFPSVSADGSKLAFVKQAPPGRVGSIADSGFDLWVANRDGSDARLVWRHETPNQQVTYPQWQDDAHLLAIVQERGPNGIVPTVVRFDVSGGARSKVVDDVLAFGLSMDGARIVYTRLAPEGGITLQTADASGRAPRELVSPNEHLSPFSWPRFSPDGSLVAFTAAESPAVRADARVVALAPPPNPSADGAPLDVWTVDARGGAPRKVAQVSEEDNPSLAWSGDGARLFVNGAKGIFEIELSNGAMKRIADGTYRGHLAWAP